VTLGVRIGVGVTSMGVMVADAVKVGVGVWV
jgi:hypothetical protein